jgi:hypothetical protein
MPWPDPSLPLRMTREGHKHDDTCLLSRIQITTLSGGGVKRRSFVVATQGVIFLCSYEHTTNPGLRTGVRSPGGFALRFHTARRCFGVYGLKSLRISGFDRAPR